MAHDVNIKAIAVLDSVLTAPVCTSLADLPPGRSGAVHDVRVRNALGDRLVELGFTVGAPVRMLRRAPFGGPVQVQIRDFVLSLRRSEARQIQVDVQGEPET